MSAIATPIRVTRRTAVSGTVRHPVAIVGAGPYGLSAAAHLAKAGVAVRVFGEPMESWIRNMPAGMLLRSEWRASHIADPDRAFGLDRFHTAHGLVQENPLPVERFADYGEWFQRTSVPNVDRRRVERIASGSEGFRLRLDDGDELVADRVVVAAGIVPFAARPPLFDGLPRELVSHSADHADLSRFGGRRVAVVGGGQSAVESAALLSEGGADVHLVVRADSVGWLPVSNDAEERSLRLYAHRRIGLGGPRSSWLVAMPALYERLPARQRERLMRVCLCPVAAGWLRGRVGEVRIETGSGVREVQSGGNDVLLSFADGGSLEVDHVLLATGYRVDVTRYAFLAPELLARIETRDGFPVLDADFGSSVPDLHFVGAPSAQRFGPVMRFVCGTWASSRGLTRGIVGRRAARAGFSW